MINHDLYTIKVKITHFFIKTKNTKNTILQINPLIIQLIILHQKMRNIIMRIINDSIQTKELTLTTLMNQIFSHHIPKMNKHDNQEIIQHHTIKFFNHRFQSIHNLINQLKCITKLRCRNIYNIMKKQKDNLSSTKRRRITRNDYDSIPNGWILNIIK